MLWAAAEEVDSAVRSNCSRDGILRQSLFVREYLAIRDAVVTPEIVRGAWRSTGLIPFNPDIFTKADFSPSRPWSTKAYFPPSFPLPDRDDAMDIDPELNPPESAHNGEEIDDITTTEDVQPSFVVLPPLLPNTPAPPEAPSPQPPSAPLPPKQCQRLQARPSPFVRSSIPRYTTDQQRLEIVLTDLERLEKLFGLEQSRCRSAEPQCQMAKEEIELLMVRLNSTTARKDQGKGKKFSLEARALTEPEAMREHQK